MLDARAIARSIRPNIVARVSPKQSHAPDLINASKTFRVTARLSIEAGVGLGWHRWVGELGEAIGMETFGASAPASALYKHFGFTPENVSETARAVVKRAKT